MRRTTLNCCETTKKQANLVNHQVRGNRVGFDIFNFLGGLLTGAVGGALLTFHFTKNVRANSHGTAIDQSGARAGGDIVGRDKR